VKQLDTKCVGSALFRRHFQPLVQWRFRGPPEEMLHQQTDFGRLDFYRQMALTLGLTSLYRRAQLWRDIKEYIIHLATQKNIMPVFIIDEAQNLPPDFFRDLLAFLTAKAVL
jgi:MSHA biogenesis protein MshM